MEEEQEELKRELIFIKDIFIKREEEEEGGEDEEREEHGGQTKDNGDLSSQLHCSTPLCEWPNQPAARPAGGRGGPWALDQFAFFPFPLLITAAIDHEFGLLFWFSQSVF